MPLPNNILPFRSNQEPVVTFPEGQPCIWCPVCKSFHEFYIGPDPVGNIYGALWVFNGDLVKPTFVPPLQIELGPAWVCHCWVHDGQITYLQNTTHPGAGQTFQLTRG